MIRSLAADSCCLLSSDTRSLLSWQRLIAGTLAQDQIAQSNQHDMSSRVQRKKQRMAVKAPAANCDAALTEPTGGTTTGALDKETTKGGDRGRKEDQCTATFEKMFVRAIDRID